MRIETISKDHYLIKTKDNFDFFNKQELVEFVQKITKNLLKYQPINGLLIIDIYTSPNYGSIIEIENIKTDEKDIDVKITVHIDNPFLKEVDYYYLKDMGIKNKDIYYYKNKFYIEYQEDNLEICSLIYGNDSSKIVNKGIKLKI